MNQLIFFGENSLRTALREFAEHSHLERNHQGLENRLIVPAANIRTDCGAIHRRERIGGLLNYYYRDAA